MDKRLGTYRKRGSIILLQIPSLSKNNNLFIAAEGSTLILAWVPCVSCSDLFAKLHVCI